MRTWFRATRATLRIARRDAWRAKGRSTLVLAMIALPIVGVSAADLTVRSAQLSPSEAVTRETGAADARVTDPGMGGAPLYQAPNASTFTMAEDYGDGAWPSGPADLAKALPAGATTIPDTDGHAELRTTHGLLDTDVRELATTDPLTAGIMRLTGGRFPSKPAEVAATTHFLQVSGLHIGSALTARNLHRTYRIVGSYELPDALHKDQVNALPGALLEPLSTALDTAGLPAPQITTAHLVAVPGADGFTWNMTRQANAHGVTVVTRDAAVHPPNRSDVPYYQHGGKDPGGSSGLPATVVTVVGLMILEICLLAGPAFAVGARRSRRQLGLVGANGGDRRHIRSVVLGGGVVIGAASAVLGTAVGLGLAVALRPLLEDGMGQRFGRLDFRPVELAGIALLAVATGLLSALVPAIGAGRQSVLSSLTGRRGGRRSSRALTVVGLAAVGLGALTAVYGATVASASVMVLGGSVLAELGFVALTPALVGLFGRLGGLLPLSPRLSLRDAVRNRGRTAPAVAAVLAAVAGAVAVSTYTVSEDAHNRAQYEASLPYGAVSMTVGEAGGRDVAAARHDVVTSLPVAVRADVDRIAVGKPGCDEYSVDPGCGTVDLEVPKADQCPLWSYGDPAPLPDFTPARRAKLVQDPRCDDEGADDALPGQILVGDAHLLTVLGIHDPAAAKALAAGRVVSFSRWNLDDQGRVGIRLTTTRRGTTAPGGAPAAPDPGTLKSFPAHEVPRGTDAYGVSLLMTHATARAAGLHTVPLGGYYTTSRLPSSAQEQKLDAALDATGSSAELHIERGYTSKNDIVLPALGLFAGIVTLGAAGIATGLAQTDAEADLATLAAVGAPGRVRRTLGGLQCGLVAAMGVVLGSVAGVLPAIGLLLTRRRHDAAAYRVALVEATGTVRVPHVPIVLPWVTLVGLLIAVPLGAGLLAAALTRSHRTTARRAAT